VYTYRGKPNHSNQAGQKQKEIKEKKAKEERTVEGKKGRGCTPKRNHLEIPAWPPKGASFEAWR